MPPDPRPRRRVKNPELLAERARWPCQVTGIPPFAAKVDTHHLVKNPRHDEPGNLFRLLHDLHLEYEHGIRRPVIARLIRAYMSSQQVEFVVAERGEEWLRVNYPEV